MELKDFNIVQAAQGVDTAVVREFKALVKNKTLEIRFHWAGKGTTGIPSRGIYGPLISAISVESGELTTSFVVKYCSLHLLQLEVGYTFLLCNLFCCEKQLIQSYSATSCKQAQFQFFG